MFWIVLDTKGEHRLEVSFQRDNTSSFTSFSQKERNTFPKKRRDVEAIARVFLSQATGHKSAVDWASGIEPGSLCRP